jgi:hypothetical protein
MHTKFWLESLKGTDHLETDLKEIGWEGVNQMHLAQDRDQWLALMNTVMNLQVPSKVG